MPGDRLISPPARIIVADHQSANCAHYQSALQGLEYRLLSVVETGRELIEQCQQHEPDLVIAESKLPDMDVMDAVEEVGLTRRLPFIVTANHFDPQQMMRIGADHVWAYLMRPISIKHLEIVMPFVLYRFRKMQALFIDIETLRLRLSSGLD
jgi:AmiR/NasT family two-component response regulator